MTQSISYPQQVIDNGDGSTTAVDTTVRVTYTAAPPAPAVQTDLSAFRVGDSCKSVPSIPSWPGAERGFGLIFNGAGHGFDLAALQSAIATFPNVLWCVCEKDDPSNGLADACDAIPEDVEWWYAYQQEENPTVDPASFKAGMAEARQIIDASGKPVKLVNKFAGYAALHPGSGHAWTEYTSDAEHIVGLDHYIRPGVGWPTNSYPVASNAWALAEQMRDFTNKPVAITEHAQLAIASDTSGSGLADAYSNSVGYLRTNQFMLVSFWLGKATSLHNPDGSLVDFMPPAGPALQTVRSLIMSQ